jgi:hypothetical protein
LVVRSLVTKRFAFVRADAGIADRNLLLLCAGKFDGSLSIKMISTTLGASSRTQHVWIDRRRVTLPLSKDAFKRVAHGSMADASVSADRHSMFVEYR